jgi:murein DD-endopeptidase MepM/ murein hydrolase activator NlpD
MRRALPIIVAGVLLGVAAPADSASTGGAYASTPGVITAVSCATGCAGLSLARVGATIRIAGTGLSGVTQVTFIGGHGDGDDVLAPATAVSPTEVTTVVPLGARNGRLRVLNADGAPSQPSRQAVAITAAPAANSGAVQAQVSASHVYFDGTNPATLSYFVDSSTPSSVTVSLIHGTKGTQVDAWGPTTVAPGTVGEVTWAGTQTASGGGVASSGKYTFEISVSVPSLANETGTRAVAAPSAASSFSFLPDVFPVQGAHTFNLGSGRFGAQRAGHIHQGQDVMADCGTPLVAARGGTVIQNAVDVNAGNYLVIHPAGGGDDMVYAHLRHPSPVKEGDTVLSGQSIGVVGETGDATACHLHFEEWTPPGWYKGGHPIDPLPDLRAWDKEAKAASK